MQADLSFTSIYVQDKHSIKRGKSYFADNGMYE